MKGRIARESVGFGLHAKDVAVDQQGLLRNMLPVVTVRLP
jgi:hypothetical protein